jgi:hypothetical protein
VKIKLCRDIGSLLAIAKGRQLGFFAGEDEDRLLEGIYVANSDGSFDAPAIWLMEDGLHPDDWKLFDLCVVERPLPD